MEGSEGEPIQYRGELRGRLRVTIDQAEVEPGGTVTGSVVVHEDDDRPLSIQIELVELTSKGGRARHVETREIGELVPEGQVRGGEVVPFSFTMPDDAESWFEKGAGGLEWRVRALLRGTLVNDWHFAPIPIVSTSESGESAVPPPSDAERLRADNLLKKAKYWNSLWSLFFVGGGLFLLVGGLNREEGVSVMLVGIGAGMTAVALAVAVFCFPWPLPRVSLRVDANEASPGDTVTVQVANGRGDAVHVGFRQVVVGELVGTNSLRDSGSTETSRPVASVPDAQWVEAPTGESVHQFQVPRDARPTWGGKAVAITHEVIVATSRTDTPFPHFASTRRIVVN